MAALLAALAFFALAQANCYYPNGTDTNEILNVTTYASCGSASKHSMCCRTNTNWQPDLCRTDGLCQNGDTIWRESCTDPLWESDGCLKLCISGNSQFDDGPRDLSSTHVAMSQCADGSWCCGVGDEGKTCCVKGQGKWIVNGKVVDTNPNTGSTLSSAPSSVASTSASFPSVISTSTSLSSSPAAPSTGPTSNATLGAGALAGTVVAAVAGLTLVIGLVFLILRRRRRSNAQTFLDQQGFVPKTELHSETSRYAYAVPHEMEGARVELPGSKMARELSG